MLYKGEEIFFKGNMDSIGTNWKQILTDNGYKYIGVLDTEGLLVSGHKLTCKRRISSYIVEIVAFCIYDISDNDQCSYLYYMEKVDNNIVTIDPIYSAYEHYIIGGLDNQIHDMREYLVSRGIRSNIDDCSNVHRHNIDYVRSYINNMIKCNKILMYAKGPAREQRFLANIGISLNFDCVRDKRKEIDKIKIIDVGYYGAPKADDAGISHNGIDEVEFYMDWILNHSDLVFAEFLDK